MIDVLGTNYSRQQWLTFMEPTTQDSNDWRPWNQLLKTAMIDVHGTNYSRQQWLTSMEPTTQDSNDWRPWNQLLKTAMIDLHGTNYSSGTSFILGLCYFTTINPRYKIIKYSLNLEPLIDVGTYILQIKYIFLSLCIAAASRDWKCKLNWGELQWLKGYHHCNRV